VWWGWPARLFLRELVGFGSPFPIPRSRVLLREGLWDVAGWNIVLIRGCSWPSGWGGSARCWVLRGHRLVFLLAPGLDCLTSRVVGVVVVVAGWGVVVC
jgi:hypothetical protein